MKISRDWLTDYVDLKDVSDAALAELLTTQIAEIESLEVFAGPVDTAKVVLVKSLRTHPEKKQLQIATVSLGKDSQSKEEVEVVCGAPNVREGMLTVYLAPGAEFYNGGKEALLKVEERAVSGILSCGVLVSEAELGISGDHSGVFDLTDFPGAKPGVELSKLIGGSDRIVDIDNKAVTHRPDLWSHYGFAREIAAILKRPLKKNIDAFADDGEEGKKNFAALGKGAAPRKTAVEKDSGCRRFTGLSFSSVRIEASPLWMRRRLHAVGAGTRNLLVDLSNYVMLDIGQPCHTYDAKLLKGDTLTARAAKAGEKFLGLDDKERTLTAEDMVIADQSGAVALAGILGGGPSAVNDSTTELFLESANFDPVRVRLTAKRHATRTDASNRFEKSQSQFSPPLALTRYKQLLLELQPQAEVVGSAVDAFLERPKSIQVSVTCDYIRSRLGVEINDARIAEILTGLKFNIAKSKGGELALDVPYFRATRDISIADDIVEEIGRIYGYGNIAESSPLIPSTASLISPLRSAEDALRDTLVGAGFSETSHYSFTSYSKSEAFGYDMSRAIEMANPIDQTLSHLRVSLIPSLADHVEKNLRFVTEIALFEMGRTYENTKSSAHDALTLRRHDRNPPSLERRMLSVAFSSGKKEKTPGEDFFALKGMLERLVALIGKGVVELRPLKGSDPKSAALDFSKPKNWMHPHRAAEVLVNAKSLGVIAEVHPSVLDGVDSRVVMAELDLDLLLEADLTDRKFRHIPKFPDSLFEMSVVMPEREPFKTLDTIFKKSIPAEVLRRIELLTVYQGKPIPDGQKSVSVKFAFGAEDRTLSTEEIADLQNKLMQSVEQGGFSLRR